MVVESIQTLLSLLQMEAKPVSIFFIVKSTFYYYDDIVRAEWQWIFILVVGVTVIGLGIVVTMWTQSTPPSPPPTTTTVGMLSMS